MENLYQWLVLVNSVKNKGYGYKEFDNIISTVKNIHNSSNENIIFNEILELEKILINSTIARFENTVNQSFIENDIEIFIKGVNNVKKDIKKCFLLKKISDYPNVLKENLGSQIENNLIKFLDDFSKYLKSIVKNNENKFIEEIYYVYKKNKLRKFVQECNIYG